MIVLVNAMQVDTKVATQRSTNSVGKCSIAPSWIGYEEIENQEGNWPDY